MKIRELLEAGEMMPQQQNQMGMTGSTMNSMGSIGSTPSPAPTTGMGATSSPASATSPSAPATTGQAAGAGAPMKTAGMFGDAASAVGNFFSSGPKPAPWAPDSAKQPVNQQLQQGQPGVLSNWLGPKISNAVTGGNKPPQ
jgi:hypothetical protein